METIKIKFQLNFHNEIPYFIENFGISFEIRSIQSVTQSQKSILPSNVSEENYTKPCLQRGDQHCRAL